MKVGWSEAINQARAMLAVLERDHPGVLERLREDALAELQGWSDLQVRMVADTSTRPDCTVAGGYRHDTSPPTLLVAGSASRRRQGFTALHELGHVLQRNDFALAASIVDPRGGEALEEVACDAFAGRVLLPDDMVGRYIGSRGPAARDVVALYEASRASRAACCVRACERLTSPGVIMLVDSAGQVSFAARYGMVPPAHGSDQVSTPLIRAALAHGGRTRRDSVISYRDSSTSDELYGDCAPCDGYLIAVLVTDRAAWLPFAPPRPGTARRVGRFWICETCSEEFRAFEPVCQRCGTPRCPSAGHCRCTTRTERTCPACNFVKHASQFATPDGVCRDCRA